MKKVQNRLPRDRADTIHGIPAFAFFLPPKDLFLAHTEPIVKIILSIGAKGSAGHKVPIAAVVQQQRSAGHQQAQAVFIRMAMGHLFFFHRNAVAQIVAV
ncbi:MAG: hypothetical protein BWY83_01587 [bacterium ADurb.Bin478]|nr:MAG: hypothetical protein BWY83_01587 [bacterium ADurb.Bin478]